MDPATLASIAVIARYASQLIMDYNTGERTPEQIAEAWKSLGISRELTKKLLADAKTQGGYR